MLYFLVLCSRTLNQLSDGRSLQGESEIWVFGGEQQGFIHRRIADSFQERGDAHVQGAVGGFPSVEGSGSAAQGERKETHCQPKVHLYAGSDVVGSVGCAVNHHVNPYGT